MGFALAAVLAGSAAVQLAALWGMGRRRPVGDEVAYLESRSAQAPGAPPQRFLRPPALPWLARLCFRPADGGEGRLRLLMATASVLTVALTAAAGWRLGGPELALLATLVLAAQPERILLGCHVWPDTLLGLVLAALALAATLPAAGAAALAAGGLAALGVLIRIDFLVVPPLLLAGWWTAAGRPAPAIAASLLLPPLLALAALAIRNYRRYGIPLPDTTWAFNLMVMGAEARRDAPRGFALEPVIRSAWAEWEGLDLAAGPGRGIASLRQAARSPLRLLRGVVRRLLALAGPDTFVRQKLFAGAAYPELGERARRSWGAALRVAFPALATVVLLGAATGRRAPESHTWPALGLLAVAALFHARTRYRVAALPALSLLAAAGLSRGLARFAASPWHAVPVLLAAALLFRALLRITCSAETPEAERPARGGRWSPALPLAALASLAVPAAAAASCPAFKIAVEETAVYDVRFEDLAAAGLDADALPSGALALANAGAPVPLWLEDGGDRSFGPGDRLEFLGRHLPGEVSYRSEETRANVYVLRCDDAAAARMTPGGSPALAAALPTRGTPAAYRTVQHLEQDLLLLRLPAREGVRDELWYWARLAHSQGEPFEQVLDLRDLEPDGGRAAGLKLQFRGWSQPHAKPGPSAYDHQVDVELNGVAVARAEWNGTEPYQVEIPALPPGLLAPGDNTLTLRIPQRAADERGTPLIDVVMLNWIEIAYPRSPWIGDGQARLTVEASAAGPILLAGAPGRDLVVYGEGGSRTVAAALSVGQEGRAAYAAQPPPGERSFFVASAAHLKPPAAIVRDRPSRLADAGNQADYVIVAHATLLDAVRPLAELHRTRGLAVEVVDVEDVYDEFGHGIAGPRALRAFLAHAYHRWRRPAPRFALLVGDASWDATSAVVDDESYADWTYRPGESTRFGKNQSTPYASGADRNRRHLIPTWNHATAEGHSASDNWFAAVDGGDDLPDLAIGRLPVVEPAEVAAIVAKTVRYASAPEAGPWRRSVLLITNDDLGLQSASDDLSRSVAAAGYRGEKIYPAKSEPSNERHTRTILDAFDRGELVVHFYGHGGRYIWRTGPPDLAKNHDLFGLDDLDRLRPTGRLPVVLSMTCYSAPFDHPNADSIGEKLLRLPGRGAVAVVAASWRNAPAPEWGRVLLAELTRPGATVGEAVMRAKRLIRDGDFVATYNLLGDPAAPVALPPAAIALDAAHAGGGRVLVRGRVEASGFTGRLAVELVDERGEVVRSATLDLATADFAVDLSTSAAELVAVRAVRAYAWNDGVDAAGGVEFTGNLAERAALAAAAGPTP